MTSPGWTGAPTPPHQARLQGVNLGGWLVAGATASHLTQFVEAGDFARLASWRFTHVRLPLDAALLDEPQGWRALDGVLATCERYQLRCILALRLPPRARQSLFAEEGQWRALLQRWQDIARRYRQAQPLLAYDLLERPLAPDDLPAPALAALGAARLSPAAARRPARPGATGGRAWNALALKLTAAIRELDERVMLVVQANEGASAAAFAHLRPTRDPHTHYSFHCFDPPAFTMQGLAAGADHGLVPDEPPGPPPGSSAGALGPVERAERATGHGVQQRSERPGMGWTHQGEEVQPAPPAQPLTYPGTIAGERWDRTRLEQRFAPALEFRRVYEVPLYVGALGATVHAPRSSQLTWIRSVLSLCHTHHIGWAYWTYKGGPFGLAADPADAYGELERYRNIQRVDYDLLGILQSEA
jgi:hypothetical protein